MKRFVFLGIAGLLFAGSAEAADIYTPPNYLWSGFYAGLNGGWGTSSNCWDDVGAFAGPDGCQNANGGLVGGQLGYRWQSDAWVYGFEAQGDWANLTGSSGSTLLPGIFTNETKIDALGMLTGQVGWAMDNTLLYLKGGLAVTDNHYNTSAVVGGLAGFASDTRVGGTVGVGIEYGLSQHVSAGLEYAHVFMPDNTVTQASVGFPFPFATITDRQSIDLVTVRLNYRF